MKSILDRYLDRVLVYANKPEAEAEIIRRELKDHLQQKVDDLERNGVPKEEATLEALRQHGAPKIIGYKLRGPFPWIDIRSHGTARGVIAIGPKAVGIFAFGGLAVGVVACGGAAIGFISAGGAALGLLFVWAGLGIGGIASAGLAIGVVATGGLAIGVIALGGQAIGAWVPPWWSGSNVISHYTAENVPASIKALEPWLNASASFDRHAVWLFLPIYLVFIFSLRYVQYREEKRVASEDDWLIDG
jgi:hypothetical protein